MGGDGCDKKEAVLGMRGAGRRRRRPLGRRPRTPGNGAWSGGTVRAAGACATGASGAGRDHQRGSPGRRGRGAGVAARACADLVRRCGPHRRRRRSGLREPVSGAIPRRRVSRRRPRAGRDPDAPRLSVLLERSAPPRARRRAQERCHERAAPSACSAFSTGPAPDQDVQGGAP